jgi:hypothetical protein
MIDSKRIDLLKRHLRQSDRHVAKNKAHVARQKEIIAELDRDGYDSTLSKEFLGILEDAQRMYQDHRDRIVQELEGT